MSRGPGLLLLAVGLAAAAVGAALDQLWPDAPVRLRLETGPGPVLFGAGAGLTIAVAAWWLLSRRLRYERTAAAAARGLAETWEERARSQETAHRRFMRELDHELKNPLQAIKTAFADLDARDGSSASVETARRQVERLRHLSGRLRQLATVESGTLVREQVDLEELVQEAIELARAAVPGADSRIALSSQRVPWRPEPVLADRELLAHAVYNLLDNALKYSGPGMPVEVHLRDDGAWTMIEIADVGCGVQGDDLPHVFEELYRGQQARDLEGSGLGLSLARRVAVAHGGDLELRSRLGQGTIAVLKLPLERR